MYLLRLLGFFTEGFPFFVMSCSNLLQFNLLSMGFILLDKKRQI